MATPRDDEVMDEVLALASCSHGLTVALHADIPSHVISRAQGIADSITSSRMPQAWARAVRMAHLATLGAVAAHTPPLLLQPPQEKYTPATSITTIQVPVHPSARSLRVLKGSYAVIKLPPHAVIPSSLLNCFGATMGDAESPSVSASATTPPPPLTSLVRTPHETSLIVPYNPVVSAFDSLPEEALVEAPWKALRIGEGGGQLDFSLTGVLSSPLAPLAAASISVFTLSTYNTDYILIRESSLACAVTLLESAGCQVVTDVK